MLFFIGQYLLRDAPTRRIVVAQILNNLSVGIDRDALGDQVFTNHVYQRIALDIFRMAPRLQARDRLWIPRGRGEGGTGAVAIRPTVGNAATLGTSGTSRTVASEHPVEAAVHGQFGGTSPGEHGASVCEPNSYCLPRQ
jgi:hypothetical protein